MAGMKGPINTNCNLFYLNLKNLNFSKLHSALIIHSFLEVDCLINKKTDHILKNEKSKGKKKEQRKFSKEKANKVIIKCDEVRFRNNELELDR